jgi:hypothetical protein
MACQRSLLTPDLPSPHVLRNASSRDGVELLDIWMREKGQILTTTPNAPFVE